MTRPRPGLQAMHDGRAVEFLWRIASDPEAEIWRVKLLFVDPSEIAIIVRRGDRLSPFHTQSPTRKAA